MGAGTRYYLYEVNMKQRCYPLALLFLICMCAEPLPADSQTLRWQGWSQSAFEEARREHRFVLLDLEAVWCHWCHVMDETTYKDPAVMRLLASRYVLVKVDQDSRPDLSNRYEDYGWPATIVFASDGTEIVKRRGYLPPEMMASMLQAIIDDPSPGPSVEAEASLVYPSKAALPKALHEELAQDFLDTYDKEHGSWGSNQKYLDWDSVEYALDLAQGADRGAEQMARETLHAQLRLLDPAWGGVYQYSTDGDWNAPHFEKIMQFQAENLRIYSLAASQWDEPEYRHAASEIHRFVTTFLRSPDGAFFSSQDADLVEGKHSAEYFALGDRERRKLGIPRIDKHIYARENGWMIAGLVKFYEATGNREYLRESLQAANWVIRNRALPGGGFRHDMQDKAGPYLGDSISMGRAFLALYAATGDRIWLDRAVSAAGFISRNFKDSRGAGYDTTRTPTDRAYAPHPQRDENVMVLRFANLLAHYTGDARHREVAETAMRYLAAEPVARRIPASSILLAERELTSPPLHLTVVGRKNDSQAQQLFSAALRYPGDYKRVEWWDPNEGKLPNHDVDYPQLGHAAAFVCTDRTCSPPIAEPEQLRAKVDRLTGSDKKAGERKGEAPSRERN
jgi:uncharacterized protein YyaL (SSP411 family)